MNRIVSLVLLSGMMACATPKNQLQISILSDKPSHNIVTQYQGFDRGGNTSVAFDYANIYKGSGESPYEHEPFGYFDASGNEIPYIKRDRDLGQTFRISGDKPVQLKSVTVRTGFGSNVVREGMWGQCLSIQIFEVIGEAVLQNNGSDNQTEAFHGFPHNRAADSIPSDRDDYYSGEIYRQITVFSGALFPQKTDFGFSSNDTLVSPGHEKLKGRYLCFQLPEQPKIVLEPAKQYAFLIMIDQMGNERGFTLANHYYGKYPDGHGIRRDGNGIFPPEPADMTKDFTDPANARALQSAHFPDDLNERLKIAPGTNGYPDVCTWRDLEFYIEAQ